MILIVAGCTNLSSKKETVKETLKEPEETSASKKDYDFFSHPVFELSAEDVYKKLSSSDILDSKISKDKSSAQFSGEKLYVFTRVFNHHDEKIDSFVIGISNSKFYDNPEQLRVVRENLKEILGVINVKYDDEKILEILKTDVEKKRKSKIDSYPEDIKVFQYQNIWIGVEGMYQTNNEPFPNQLRVMIYPAKPEF